MLPNILKVNQITSFLARVMGRVLCSDVNTYVFCANTGRCGSTTLSAIFSSVENCSAHHEPHPSMAGSPMIEFNLGNKSFTKNIFFARKLPNIYWSAYKYRHYVELNHMFIKCFADLAVDEFSKKMKVIYLHRDYIDTACSLYNRHFIKEWHIKAADSWMLNFFSEKSNNLITIDALLNESPLYNHMFYRALWNCYEIEARTTKFSLDHPWVPIFEIKTADLNSYTKVKQLITNLGMKPPDNLEGLTGLKLNKNEKPSTLPEGILADDVHFFQAACIKKLNHLGLRWPHLKRGQTQ